MILSIRFSAITLAALFLSACGGGGGDGPKSDSMGGDFTIDRSGVTFNATLGGLTPAPQVVNGTITNVSGNVYLYVESPGTVLAGADVVLTGPNSGQLTLYPKAPSLLGVGMHTETVLIRACLDAGCSRQVRGSPRSINVTYNVIGIVATPAFVSLVSVDGVTLPPATVALNVHSSSNSWSTSVSYSGSASGWLTVSPSTGLNGATTLTVTAATIPGAPSVRNYNATITVTTAGFVRTIPVSYLVTPNLSVAPSPVGFSAVAGQPALPSAAVVNVSARASTSYTTNIAYHGGATDWLSVTGNQAPGTLGVVPNTTNLPPTSSTTSATYSATVTLTPSSGWSFAFDVNYVVSPSVLTVNPLMPTFNINAQSTAQPVHTQRSLTTADSGASLMWTATSSVPWLAVTPGGISGQSASLNLVLPELAAIRNGPAVATIYFDYSGPGFTGGRVPVTVQLNMNLPSIDFVAPYVGYVNEQLPVVIRGSGFSQAGVGALLFGTDTAQNVSVISDTEMRVTPPLKNTPNRYSVAIPNNLGLSRSAPTFVVRNHPNYTSFFMSYPGILLPNLNAIYDAERDAVITSVPWYRVLPTSSVLVGLLKRYAFDQATGQWSVTTSTVPYMSDVAMSPDGRFLLALTTAQLHYLDPTTLAIVRSVNLPRQTPANATTFAITNDGNVLMSHIDSSYSLVGEVFAPFTTAVGRYFMAISGNGARVVMGYPDSAMNTSLAYYESGNLTVTNVYDYFWGGRLSRDGSKLLGSSDVRDRNLNLIGTIANRSTLDAPSYDTLSSDGSKVYSYWYSATGPRIVRVLDAATPSDPLLELSNFAVNDNPGQAMPIVTPDGKHLFLVGETGFTVMPLP